MIRIRGIKYMRTFTAVWPDPSIVQRVVAQIPWRSNLALLDKLDDSIVRQWDGSVFRGDDFRRHSAGCLGRILGLLKCA